MKANDPKKRVRPISGPTLVVTSDIKAHTVQGDSLLPWRYPPLKIRRALIIA